MNTLPNRSRLRLMVFTSQTEPHHGHSSCINETHVSLPSIHCRHHQQIYTFKHFFLSEETANLRCYTAGHLVQAGFRAMASLTYLTESEKRDAQEIARADVSVHHRWVRFAHDVAHARAYDWETCKFLPEQLKDVVFGVWVASHGGAEPEKGTPEKSRCTKYVSNVTARVSAYIRDVCAQHEEDSKAAKLAAEKGISISAARAELKATTTVTASGTGSDAGTGKPGSPVGALVAQMEMVSVTEKQVKGSPDVKSGDSTARALYCEDEATEVAEVSDDEAPTARNVKRTARAVRMAHARHSTRLNKYYSTPAVVEAFKVPITALLAGGVSRHATVWEPCVGGGALVPLLKSVGFTVIASDIEVDPDVHAEERDMFSSVPDGDWQAIVTNPPWGRDTPKVLERVISLGKPFVLLLPLSVLGTKYFQHQVGKCSMEVFVLSGQPQFYSVDEKRNMSVGCVMFVVGNIGMVSPAKRLVINVVETDMTDDSDSE